MLKTKSLTPQAYKIIREEATEYPGTGEYNEFAELGTYLCRNCGLALYRSDSKFISQCGWPSFDAEISDHVWHRLDKDGRRTEILCRRCTGHLGHIFRGEGYTALNVRHCVNSLSLDFVLDTDVLDSAEAIVAAGCFWGVEQLFKKLPGVLKTEVGYSGGDLAYPTYEDVCRGASGHLEVVRVLYDVTKLSYEDVIKYFFEIHDFEQIDGQGPDKGEQYLSAIFYYNPEQYKIASQVLEQLQEKSYKPVTKLREVEVFWPAEPYHQGYYEKSGKVPYCHAWRQIFKD